MIHLDTNFLIRALVPGSREDEQLRGWLRMRMPVGVSAVSWTEFLCGPVRTDDVTIAAEVLREPEPFLADDSALAARLFATGGRRRGSLADCMIAATAIRVDAELATTNTNDFRRFETAGLKLASA